MTISEGTTFETRSGTAVVVQYNGSRNVLVRFLETGYTTTTTAFQVREGTVLDRAKMLDKYKAQMEERKKPRYDVELHDGKVLQVRTYKELASLLSIPENCIKNIAIGRSNSTVIKSITRL